MQNAAKLKKKITKKVETKVGYSNPFILTTSNFKKQQKNTVPTVKNIGLLLCATPVPN